MSDWQYVFTHVLINRCGLCFFHSPHNSPFKIAVCLLGTFGAKSAGTHQFPYFSVVFYHIFFFFLQALLEVTMHCVSTHCDVLHCTEKTNFFSSAVFSDATQCCEPSQSHFFSLLLPLNFHLLRNGSNVNGAFG